jgi:hypothetical protein
MNLNTSKVEGCEGSGRVSHDPEYQGGESLHDVVSNKTLESIRSGMFDKIDDNTYVQNFHSDNIASRAFITRMRELCPPEFVEFTERNAVVKMVLL